MEVKSEHTCGDCGYFLQHYIFRGDRTYRPINCGHCVHPPRLKRCTPITGACPKWIAQDEEFKQKHPLP